ncbi:MAG: hypothetical protein ACTSRU_13080 [Candidatus Hodarchaeales archaeon]
MESEHKPQTSAEILEYLNRKSFASLSRNDLIYSTGELGTLPEIYPLLLLAIRRFITTFRDSSVEVEIDPGLGITLQQLSMGKITPNSIISFGKKLKSGEFLCNSFSPVKEFNWNQASNLLQQIGEEIDSIIEDFSSLKEWEDQEYDIIVKIITEKAMLVNDALHSQGFSTMEFGKPQKYSEVESFVTKIDINYDKAPLSAYLTIPLEFSKDDRFLSFFNTVEAVFRVATEPISQLNDDSLSTKEKVELLKYIEEFIAKLNSTFIPLSKINDVIDSLFLEGAMDSEQIKVYMKRYFGTISARLLAKQYIKIISDEIHDRELLASLEEFITRKLQRSYFLGIISKFDYTRNLLSIVPDLLKEFSDKINLDSVKKEDLKNASIKVDIQLRDNPEKYEDPLIAFQNYKNDFQQYVLQEFYNNSIDKIKSRIQDPEVENYSLRLKDYITEILSTDDVILCSKDEYQQSLTELVDIAKESMPGFLDAVKLDYFNQNIMFLFSPLFFDVGMQNSNDFEGFPLTHIFQFFKEFVKRWEARDNGVRNDLVQKLLKDQYINFNQETTIRLIEYIDFAKRLEKDFVKIFDVFIEIASEEIPNTQINWTHHFNDFQIFLEFWFKDFSGLMPDEITLRLNTGILYLNLNYVLELAFAAYIEKDNDGPIDFGRLKEKGRLLMEAHHDGYQKEEGEF